MYNDVIIRSNAAGGSKLLGTLNKPQSPKGGALFLHNSHGSREAPLMVTLEELLLSQGLTTLRFNFHYVEKIPIEEAKFEDVIFDVDAAYSFLLQNVTTPNVFLIGHSLGGVAAMEYAIQSGLRNPIIVLGFFEPMVLKYITEPRLKDFKGKLLVLHGANDQYVALDKVRTILGVARLNFTLLEIQNATHSFASSDETVRPSSEIIEELKKDTLDFVSKSSI